MEERKMTAQESGDEMDKEGAPTGDNVTQQMVGHHRHENPEERKPETYHFSRQDLAHPRESIGTEEK